MTSEPPSTAPRHAVGVVCRWTGLKPDRLRAWERRYDVVQPSRSEGNQRLYSDADVERLTLLQQATAAGHRIAGIATLSTEQLRQLARKDRGVVAPQPAAPGDMRVATDAVQACLFAIQQLDAERLRFELARMSAELSGSALAERLLAPLIDQIGQLWSDGGLQPAHEHLATAVLTRFIDEARARHPVAAGAPTMLLSTLSGQRHELGALLAAEAAAGCGWNTVYLGPDLPAVGVAGAARQAGARIVGLSLVYPHDDPAIPAGLELLRAHVGEQVDILVGGAAAPSYDEALTAVGALRVDQLAQLRQLLHSRVDTPG